MTRTKTRKMTEIEEDEEAISPPQRCTRSKFRANSGKDKSTDPSLRAEMASSTSLMAKSPASSRIGKPMVTPVHSASASKTIRSIQDKLLSSSKSVSSSRTVNLTNNTPSFSRLPSHSKLTTPTYSASGGSKFVSLTGSKFASGVKSFLGTKTTPNKHISPIEEMKMKEARLKEKEQKEKERQQRLKDRQEADMEEKRRKNKERQEKAEQLRLEREKAEAASRMKVAKTKTALNALADKNKVEKDKEERERKKEMLRRAEMAEIKRKEEEHKKMARQQQQLEEERMKEEERRKKQEEGERERQKKIDDQRKMEEQLRMGKQKAERQEQERLRRQAEEKERERQKLLELKKKEIEKQRNEKQKQEMERLRQKEIERANATKKDDDARPKPELPKPNLNHTYDANSTQNQAPQLDSTYNVPASNANPNETFDVTEHVSSYDMTPKRLPAPSTTENYVIDDLASDDETDDEDNPKKKIPTWAEKHQLRSLLVKQTYKPPNLADLFGVIEPPDLTQIFTKTQKKRYVRRGSSGIWDCPILPPGDTPHL